MEIPMVPLSAAWACGSMPANPKVRTAIADSSFFTNCLLIVDIVLLLVTSLSTPSLSLPENHAFRAQRRALP
jgi:hypothetical protein